MEFIEQYHVVNSLRDYLINHSNCATQQDVIEFLKHKHRVSLSRRTFVRYLDIIREIFGLEIEYSFSTNVYKIHQTD